MMERRMGIKALVAFMFGMLTSPVLVLSWMAGPSTRSFHPDRPLLFSSSSWRLHSVAPREAHHTTSSTLPRPLTADDRPAVVPRHLGIILDGNGRWGEQRGLSRSMGHAEGAKRALEVVRACADMGVQALTLYCLSTENWQRPASEVHLILRHIEESLREQLPVMRENGVRLMVIGQRDKLPMSLRVAVAAAEESTRRNEGMTLCLALSYGGRDEIAQAARSLAEDCVAGYMRPSDIDERLIGERLESSRKGLGPLDLVIRTSGERRLSNFMLFQMAYAEIYVSEVLWPDFDENELREAVRDYGQRSRRFGGVPNRQEGC